MQFVNVDVRPHQLRPGDRVTGGPADLQGLVIATVPVPRADCGGLLVGKLANGASFALASFEWLRVKRLKHEPVSDPASKAVRTTDDQASTEQAPKGRSPSRKRGKARGAQASI